MSGLCKSGHIYYQLKCPIIPELFSILFTTGYSQNYSRITDACLIIRILKKIELSLLLDPKQYHKDIEKDRANCVARSKAKYHEDIEKSSAEYVA